MTTKEFLEKVCVALDRPAGSVKLEDTPESLREWDSTGHLAIISALDDCFAGIVDEKEFRHFASMKELVEKLRARKLVEG